MEKGQIDSLLRNLKNRGFKAEFFPDAKAAKAAVLEQVEAGQSVGIGGSMTVFDMGIHKDLAQRGNEVFWHWLVEPSEAKRAHDLAAKADVYLTSTNALTQSGELVNIDGTGNRVSSMFFGPNKVIVICGENKITGDFESAIRRIKDVASPLNARRLKLDTPCAVTGKCTDCSSKKRMCNVTIKLERPTYGKDIHVYVVGESLGY